MVAISLCRGNLHRVSDAPRQWPMPPRSITLGQFRILNHKRHEALARIATPKPPNLNHIKDDQQEAAKVEEEPHEGGEQQQQQHQRESKNLGVSDAEPIKVEGESKEMIDANAKANEEVSFAAIKGPETATTDVKIEVNNKLDTDKGKRKIELEKKLQVLNEKKHHLVQILKQILNVEEEIKRRNAQAAATLRFSIPLPPETAVDMGSATRHVPKLSVEVNFSGDLTAESDATANNSAYGRQIHHMHSTFPSAVPLARPLQQNTFLSTSRSSLATIGHVQAPSNASAGNTGAATSSPPGFASGHQGQHHSASLPPVSVPGSHFMASSPSPAASGGSSSVFRDSRLTSSS